ncbi:nitrate- and nitrite sensing domain-containing protein [Streptomyces sp. NRRL F-5126]|uniref:sensor histidine kinase n=1 Tax=Streptomyces sp. NRRL F-5126 TaxID=1463857 RepID=UPI000A6946F2|nr:nitrate- and nitrite sensing domain-containing protein [Streptomyces sp. NRRL F-5126]
MHSGTPVGRPKRVRTRLVAGVAVVGVAVLAAGTPAVLHGWTGLDDAQRLVTLARLDSQAVALAGSLADERDQAVVFVAAGRPSKDGESHSGESTGGEQGSEGSADGLTAAGERVDRGIAEFRALAAESGGTSRTSGASASARALKSLGTLEPARKAAVTGNGRASATYTAYSRIIASLGGVFEQVADHAPADAAPDARAAASLGRAADQASATRGLLVAALTIPDDRTRTTTDPITGLTVTTGHSGSSAEKARDALSAAAQQARVGELAALADFDAAASASTRQAYESTVAGAGTTSAEKYLGRLTAAPRLPDSALDTDRDKLNTALTARIDRMRGALSGLDARELKGFEKLRDSAVRDLELRAALLAGCLVLAVAVSVAVARTLTRPLAAVRLGAARVAARPATREPVRFTGRNDEFADVARSLNALHSTVLSLTARLAEGAAPESRDRAEHDRKEAAADLGAAALAAEERAGLQARIADTTDHLRRLRHTVRHTFVDLSLRNLGLVERQLGVIESLEEREQDPERLGTLYKLDHMATVMRRHSENLLVLAEHRQVHAHAEPVPLVDVLRAAVSEIERYERVTIQTLPPQARVSGAAADDLSHLVAELLENAASFSPPGAAVELSGWLLETGEVMLSVVDQGEGVAGERLAELNARLTAPDHEALTQAPTEADEAGEGLGLRVVSLLAARHGVRVELRRQQQGGGTTAVVVLPRNVVPPEVPEAAEPGDTEVAAGAAEPGSAAAPESDAEPGLPEFVPVSGPRALPERPGAAAGRERAPYEASRDPLILAAEATVRAAESAGAIAPETAGSVPGGEPRVPAARTPVQAPDQAPGRGTAQDPYAAGPDSHERAAAAPAGGDGLDQDTFAMRLPQRAAASRELPKRVPKAVRSAGAPPVRKRGVDPEELRRRLGGFHSGARAGRQEAEEEIRQAATRQPQAQQHPYEQEPPTGQQAASQQGDVRHSDEAQGYERQPYGRQAYEPLPYTPRIPQARTTEHLTARDQAAGQHTEAAGDTVEEARS